MDTKPPECFGTDPRARGLRVELSPTHSLVLPHEHFVYSELKAEKENDILKLVFVTHEVVLIGYMLRRVESGMQTRELAWIVARPERYRSPASDKAFILRIEVRLLEDPQPQPNEEVRLKDVLENDAP
ncbi:MAG: hypothetical protein L0Z50_26245 [Verrucomicrobiales bacterium]|nr:hypothetical protein [Verrucomicrobiales bacterium]